MKSECQTALERGQRVLLSFELTYKKLLRNPS